MKMFGRKPVDPIEHDHVHAVLDAHFVDDGTSGVPAELYVPSGWASLILDTHVSLVELMGNYKLLSLREYHGGMQIFIDNPTDQALAIIKQAEALSRKTCEHCGRRGRFYDIDNDGFLITLCRLDRLAMRVNDILLDVRYGLFTRPAINRKLKQSR